MTGRMTAPLLSRDRVRALLPEAEARGVSAKTRRVFTSRYLDDYLDGEMLAYRERTLPRMQANVARDGVRDARGRLTGWALVVAMLACDPEGVTCGG